MIDININAIISQALAAAVQQAIQPLQQEYANKMAEMAQQIAKLEMQSANRHERLLVLEGALTDRVLALENNPAQGVDTMLEEAAVNKDKHERLLFVLQHLTARVTALENNPAQGADTTLEETLQHLDDQEWFWDKIRRFTNGAVESAVEGSIERHCEDYDHDDFVTEDSFRDEINNATIKLRF